ncbi:MAG: hypothetical protein CMK03_03885, partial [Ponticaulis sp.]|nr:hypothetical protein [Ponticaulis sp.]
MSEFEPDYRNVEAAARNQRPRRLPIYEHLINVESIEKLLDRRFGDLLAGDAADVQEYFDIFCGFWREMTYDTVSFEVHTLEVLPGGGALLGEQDGPIQNHSDFERYPWDDLPRRFMEIAVPRFEALRRSLPPGMKIVGGVGNGLFEVSEDLVGFEKLCYMLADDPKLFAALYKQIGDLLAMLWKGVLERFADLFAICRIGDDMGFKTATLMAPPTLIEHVVPQYARLAEQIHEAGRPFLLHSCGRIFDLMEPLIAAGIDAKHSNEDAIA